MFLPQETRPLAEPQTDAVGKALLDAADYIEKHGHCKRQLEDRAGRVCLVGALLKVADGDLILVQRAYLRIEHTLGSPDFVGFNNEPNTKPADVTGLLRRAGRAPHSSAMGAGK